MRTSALLLLAVAHLRPIRGQLTDDSGEAPAIWGLSNFINAANSTICNGTFADANATGFYTTNPDVTQGPQEGQPDNYSGMTEDFDIAVTIANAGNADGSNTTSSSYSVWASTNGANYSNNLALGYDVCGLAGFSLNYNTQLRGQSDNSSCLSTLDEPCISAIESTAAQWAQWLSTPSTATPSNLTNTSLPTVCRRLASAVRENFPNECSYFFEPALDGLGWPFTSYGNLIQTVLSEACTINGTYDNVISFFANNSMSIYDAWYQSVTPIILVWMPITYDRATQEDSGAFTSIGESVARLKCLHTDTVTENSDQPPAAPNPTPVAYNSTSTNTTSSNTTASETSAGTNTGNGLSGGAIAGIVIGVVVGLALVAGLLFWLWRSKTHKTVAAAASESAGPMVEAPGDYAQHELPAGERVQLPATEQEGAKTSAFLDGKQVDIGELEGASVAAQTDRKEEVRNPVELP